MALNLSGIHLGNSRPMRAMRYSSGTEKSRQHKYVHETRPHIHRLQPNNRLCIGRDGPLRERSRSKCLLSPARQPLLRQAWGWLTFRGRPRYCFPHAALCQRRCLSATAEKVRVGEVMIVSLNRGERRWSHRPKTARAPSQPSPRTVFRGYSRV